MSREAFGEDAIARDINIAKVIYFFENHWSDIVRFSRRKEEEINSWAQAYTKSDCDVEKALDISKTIRNRYSAINLYNRNTVEFRIFKGSLNPDTIRAMVDFCDIIIKNAKRYDIDDIPFLSFGDWVEGRSGYLERYIYSRNINLYSTKSSLDVDKSIRSKVAAIMTKNGGSLGYVMNIINNYEFSDKIKSKRELIESEFAKVFGESEHPMASVFMDYVDEKAADVILLRENMSISRHGTLRYVG